MSAQAIIQFPVLNDETIRRAFTESFPGIRWIMSPEGRFIWLSKTFQQECGLSPDAVLGRTYADVFGAELGAELNEIDEQARRTNQTVRAKVTVPTPAGRRWRGWITPLSGGRVLGSAILIF